MCRRWQNPTFPPLSEVDLQTGLFYPAQTRSGSSKALASAPGLRTVPKGSHWRAFRRRRGTNSTGRLINQSFQQGCARISGLVLSRLLVPPRRPKSKLSQDFSWTEPNRNCRQNRQCAAARVTTLEGKTVRVCSGSRSKSS
jgi:hypothetical protein